MARFADIEKCSGGFLRADARPLDHIDIGLCAAISDRRLVRIHLNDRVVHAHGGKSGKHVLDRVHPH